MHIKIWESSVLPPAFDEWLSAGEHKCELVTHMHFAQDEMVLVDESGLRSIQRLAEVDPRVKSQLEKDPLVLIRPSGLLLSVIQVPYGVAAIINYAELELLEVAMCPQQLDPKIINLVDNCGILPVVLEDLRESVSLNDLVGFVPVGEMDHVLGCSACTARVQFKVDKLNHILRLDPKIGFQRRLRNHFGDRIKESEFIALFNACFQVTSTPYGLQIESVDRVRERWGRHKSNCTRSHSEDVDMIFVFLALEAMSFPVQTVGQQLMQILGIPATPEFEELFRLSHGDDRKRKPLSQA